MPRYIRVGGVKLQATDFGSCTHYLIDIIESSLEATELVYDCFGVLLTCKAINAGKFTYVYADVDNYLVPVLPEVNALVHMAAADDREFYYNAPTVLENILVSTTGYLLKHREIKRFQNKSGRQLNLSKLHKEKISGTHQLHFLADEVYEALTPLQRIRVIPVLKMADGFSTTAIGGMMLWASQVPDDLLDLVVRTGLFTMPDYSSFSKLGKVISVAAKKLQNLTDLDLRYIFELDVLVNRVTTDMDWHEEMMHRTKPNLVTIDPGLVYHSALRMFTEPDSTREPAKFMEWGDFWANRWQWSASGSYHSQYPDDLKFLEKDQNLRNKFIALIKMGTVKAEQFLNRTPEIAVWSSVKYEWGKLRAIYGTDITSYILTHFAFYNVEDTLPAQFPVGKKARPSFVSAKIDGVLHGSNQYCLDFEDFNSQHSSESMKAVMQAWVDANKTNLSDDQVLAANWAIQSVDNTVITDNVGLKIQYKSRGTLMSGWRLTTFINSVLNYIYTTRLIKDSHTYNRSAHNGDDVILGMKNTVTLKYIHLNAKKHNIRLQATKSFYGSIAEFLRVDHRRGQHGQYLSRNVATLMHSRIESKMAITAVDAIEALENRLAEFTTRGGLHTTAANLRDIYYHRISQIYNTEVEDLYRVKTTHTVCGGMSQRPDSSIQYRVQKLEKKSVVDLPDSLPGEIDYARQIQKVLDLTDIPIGLLVQRVHTATLGSVRMVRARLTVTPTIDKQKYIVSRGIYKAYSELNEDASIGKALMTGFAFELIGKRAKYAGFSGMIHNCLDPLHYMNVVL